METIVAYKALKAAGLSSKASKCATLKARQYLTGLGSSSGTTTVIPKNRK